MSVRASVRDAWRAFNAPLEGDAIPYPYLDIKGLVTVGTGNLIDPVGVALTLPWVVAGTDTPATAEHVRSDWTTLKGRTDLARRPHVLAAQVTTIRLTYPALEALLYRVLAANHVELCRHLTTLQTAPADAQLAVHSMSWAMGPAFPRRWPRFSAAFERRDYVGAARECAINATGNPGVIPRNYLNAAHLIAASQVVSPDFDALTGPCTLRALPDWARAHGVVFGHNTWTRT